MTNSGLQKQATSLSRTTTDQLITITKMTSAQKVLVIGAGELGQQVLQFLVQHPQRAGVVAVLLRPGSISSADPSKQALVDSLRTQGVHLVPGDIVADSEETLAATFAAYDTVIGCTGFVSGQGIQVKVTRAVLASGASRYIPWQFGVDYDVIGRGSPQNLFDEQLDVRDLLRSQGQTRWAIISTGMFTSFLFEPSFGVVDVHNSTIRALGAWDNRVTLTTPEDIGRLTAEIVLGGERDSLLANRVVFIGGDTVSYGQVAQIVESIAQKPFKREVLKVADVQAQLQQAPDNGLLKYQAVFGQGRGVSWEISETWNAQRGIGAKTAEEWARDNLRL